MLVLTAHLQEHEDDSDHAEWPRQWITTLHGADERTHDDRKQRWQQAAQQQYAPPTQGQEPIRLTKHAEELPVVTITQSLDHSHLLT